MALLATCLKVRNRCLLVVVVLLSVFQLSNQQGKAHTNRADVFRCKMLARILHVVCQQQPNSAQSTHVNFYNRPYYEVKLV